jgi:geranylgeranyl pyrophosphate synthase
MSVTARLLEPDAGLTSSLRGFLEELTGFFESEEEFDPRLWDTALLDPARDILGRSGKGLRARLLECAWQLAEGGPEGPPELLPVTIELLHVGSLVIDDIEDDSPLRRGEPTLHRRYGLPIALNTGNWLYFLPLALLSRLPLSDELRLALYADISVALLRCHEGQALDLSVQVTSVRRSDVPGLVAGATRLKTGSLMQLAAVIGARAAGGSPQQIETIGRFGAEFGVALQMLDDWSGIGVDDRRDKGIEDIKLARATWPWAWLSSEDDELVYAELVRQVRSLSIDWEAERVLERLRAVLGPKAPGLIRDHLDAALEGLVTVVGECPQIDALRADVEGLERAFFGT